MSEEQNKNQGVHVNEFGIVEGVTSDTEAEHNSQPGLADAIIEERQEVTEPKIPEGQSETIQLANELDEKGKYITKVNHVQDIEPVLGLGSSRAYVYFQDRNGHTVVDRAFGEKMVKSVGQLMRGELPVRETVKMSDSDYLKMEAECKRLAMRVGELEEWNRNGQAALDEVKREKAELEKSGSSDGRELREKVIELANENTALLGAADLKDKTIADLKEKLEQVERDLAERHGVPPVAPDEEADERNSAIALEQKRKAAEVEMAKRKACGFSAHDGEKCAHKCAECGKCARATYKGHLIMMKCMAFGFQTWETSGCMETMAQKGVGVTQEITDVLAERWIAEGKAARCVKCGKVVGLDEFATNKELCAECMDASWKEYLSEHPEAEAKVAAEERKVEKAAAVSAEQPKITVEDPNALGPICVPFGGKCQDCIYWHTAHCCTPTNLKTSKAKCFTMRLAKSQRDALEATMRSTAEDMVRMVEGRKAGQTTTLIDESGERIIETFDDNLRKVNETQEEEHEW